MNPFIQTYMLAEQGAKYWDWIGASYGWARLIRGDECEYYLHVDMNEESPTGFSFWVTNPGRIIRGVRRLETDTKLAYTHIESYKHLRDLVDNDDYEMLVLEEQTKARQDRR